MIIRSAGTIVTPRFKFGINEPINSNHLRATEYGQFKCKILNDFYNFYYLKSVLLSR